MAKRKKAAADDDVLPAGNIVDAGGESPKKKIKKKKRKNEGQEEDNERVLSSTLSSPGSSSASPKKKKKKIIVEDTQQWNGLKEEEEAEEKTKKKKKKKKGKEEEEEEEEAVVKAVQMDIQEEGVTKKKKRRRKMVDEEEEALRKKKEEEEEEALRMKEEEEKKTEKKKKKKKQDPSTSTPAPAPAPASSHIAKQKRGVKEEEQQQEEQEEEEEREKEEIHEWRKEDTADLLERVTSQIPAADKDTRSCRVTVKRVDWGAAAPPGHSPDDARDHFMALYKKINLFKNLATVVSEMQKMVDLGLKDRRNRPSFPINRFLKDFLTPEKKLAAQRRGENLFRLGHEAWKNLSEAQKAQYSQKYQEECARLQPRDDEKLEGPVKLPKTPHQLYIEVTKGRGRTPYTSLTPSEQVPYIRQSLESIMRYQDDIAAHVSSDQDTGTKSCPTPTKGDLKTYLQAYGCPETPPLRPQNLYYWELVTRGELDGVPGTRKMMEALRRFKCLGAAEKLRYKEMHAKRRAAYEAKILQWRKSQDEVTLLALKMYSTTAETTKKAKDKPKPQSVKAEEAFPIKAPALLTSCPKFLGEPPRPVPTPFRLFVLKYRTSVETTAFGRALQRELREGWNMLTEEQKGMYVARCDLLKKEFEQDVKRYVREMDQKKRALYLGFNRVSLFKLFGNRDVFADEFPNSLEYPVFVKEPKANTSPSKPHPAPETPQSDPEEEEEEEEDLPTPKKVKHLSPPSYSALISAPPQPSSKGSKHPSSTPPAIPSPKKKGKAPPPPMSESEEEEEEEEQPLPAPSPKKWKVRPSPPPMSEPEEEDDEEEEEAPPAPSPKKKGKAPPPPPAAMSESEEEEEEEEEEIFFKSKSKPQHKLKSSLASHAVSGLRDVRKIKPEPQPPPSESGSELTSDEESEEDVLPAWAAATPSPRQALTKRK